MEYRKATIQDVDQLARVRLEMRTERDNPQNSNPAEFYSNTYQYFKRHIADESFVSWIAVENEEIIATSGIYFYSVPPVYSNITGSVAYIMNMYTKPEYRKMGIASDLLSRLIEETRARNCTKITLKASEMGKPLYEKYGFQEAKDSMEYSLET
ncbi:GNAT family N-acetyltransferase [Caproiciproducens sp.]|uniref:GNAT family N-acetyltransferase n=1 Tax=Caproiciproducens sp. TaxID=1954376 RepID=UPI0028A13982|nr:GNAT family N-acetyltransferase [Caproiciproducens sp.]